MAKTVAKKKKASAKKVSAKKASKKAPLKTAKAAVKSVAKSALKKTVTKLKPAKTKDAAEKIKKVHAELVEDHHHHEDQPIDVHAKPDADTHAEHDIDIHAGLDADSDEALAADDLDIEQPTHHKLPTIVSDGGAVRSRDPLTTYLNEIRKYPVLSKEEEAVLAKRYFETKDPEAAQALVRANLRFVVKIAAEYADRKSVV